ncbi:hypothetical protein OKW21_004352 [Catalinimonas alkaloidigena]|jgi:hypothetical protein|uniref:hypothetical protein n=1 Tax=Catalinimonas alkaloidigena TaxID=1075417 RepID=UPI002406DF1F|nr:hypothetical protein [Catalinimonas alkaloidigena]MDF9799089.1 hypothetical protein [Catalinimonas alkaloidigena]
MLAKYTQIKSSAIIKFQTETNKKINNLVRVMKMVEVVNDEGDKAIVAAAIREGKQLIKQVGAARKAITTPMQDEIKNWIAREKELITPIEEAIQKADNLIQQFNARIAAEQQAMLDKIAREEQQRSKEEGGNAEQVRQESQFKRQIAVAQHSIDGVRKVWTFEVKDLSQVPRHYLMLDEQKVRQAIREGKRDIAGLSIFQKQQTVYR